VLSFYISEITVVSVHDTEGVMSRPSITVAFLKVV
jgi:hypothetical protein